MDSTMMMRTKAVIISSSDGSSVSVVINASSCRFRLYWVPRAVLLEVMPGRSGAAMAMAGTRAQANTARNDKRRRYSMSSGPGVHVHANACRRNVQGGDGLHGDAQQHVLAIKLDQGDFLAGTHGQGFDDLEAGIGAAARTHGT